MIAVITAERANSIRLHEKLGFRMIGRYEAVGLQVRPLARHRPHAEGALIVSEMTAGNAAQYSTSQKLAARARLHTQYSVSEERMV